MHCTPRSRRCLRSPLLTANTAKQKQVQELEAALEKAVAALDNEDAKSHIAANLHQCARQLHERLQSLQAAARQQAAAQQPEQQQPGQQQQQDAAARGAKRTRRGGKAAAEVAADAAEADVTEEEMAEAEAELTTLPLLETAGGYTRLVAATAAGIPDARFSASALLLSRRLPAAELVLAHVQRLAPVPPPPEAGDCDPAAARQCRAQALVVAAGVTLGLCSALACEAGSPEDALRMFAPAVGQLTGALQLLLEQEAEGQQAAAPAATLQEVAQLEGRTLQEVAQLAGRTLASMHAALEQQRQAPAGGCAASSYWRSNPQAPSLAEAAEAARSAAASLCSLLTTLRLHASSTGLAGGSQQRQQLEASAAGAAADVRQLAPFGPSGVLDYLASLVRTAAGAGW